MSISGDGGFLYSASELETAVRLKCHLVHLVWIDGAYDMVRFQEMSKYGRAAGVEFGPVDVVPFAEAFGAQGLRIERPEQIAPTLKRALAMQGPVVVGIPVDYRDNHRLMEIVHPNVLNCGSQHRRHEVATATNAWLQHPVGYEIGATGELLLTSVRELLWNPWILWQYPHTMIASVVTASFVMAGLGAFYLLMQQHEAYGRLFVRVGVVAGLAATLLMVFPTGDGQGKMVAQHQPVTLAAMEGLFETAQGAPLALVGQPDMEHLRLDNPMLIPDALSVLTYRRWTAEVRGLHEYPREAWPDNIPLLYYSDHILVGLGTLFIAVLALSGFCLWRRRLYANRALLWTLMLSVPFPYIAATAGWMTAELGRRPWLMDGLMRTIEGASPRVSAGSGLFTRLGFMGLDLLLGLLFVLLVIHEVAHGPEAGAVELELYRPDSEAVLAEGGIPIMAMLWFCLATAMIAGYVILDGFDLGAGIVQLLVAKSEREKAQVLRAIGPVWDGNEVWLLAAAGVLFVAFPALYASAFSGFYLALMMVLWLLMLRGISTEFRNHIDNLLWKPAWDTVFGGASAALACLFGVALGNVVRGVPLDANGYFFLPLWTNFAPGANAGVIDGYTLLVGATAFVALGVHGSLWVVMKTAGRLQEGTRALSAKLWWDLVAITLVMSPVSFAVQSNVLTQFRSHPWGVVFPALALTGLVGVRVLSTQRKDLGAFLASSLYLVGMLASVAFGVFPNVLPSNTTPNFSLTIDNAAAAEHG